MKALRLELYQQMACYKKPIAFKVAETYPLPPHSTIKGMLHAILEADRFIEMQLSIQGNYDTLVTDYQTHYFFKKDKTNEFVLNLDGLGMEKEMSDITSMPIYTHMLYDVKLLIHVQAEDSILEQLKERITNSDVHLSLGRWEDLVRIDNCQIVDLVKPDKPMILSDYHRYIDLEDLQKSHISFFPYRLNWKYEILNGSRIWQKLNVGYVQPTFSRSISASYYWLDSHGEKDEGVFFVVPK